MSTATPDRNRTKSSASDKQLTMPPITEAEIERFGEAFGERPLSDKAQSLLADADAYGAIAGYAHRTNKDASGVLAKRALRRVSDALHAELEVRK